MSAPVARAARDDAAGAPAPLSTVEKLIAELGSDDYAVRRRAEEQLIRLGPEAFDALKAAEDDPDLEIAERVRYIVQRMRVTWVRPEDGADVRRLLAQFSDLSENKRNERIRQLKDLDDHAGLAALCRITRFDQSPLVARRAALTVLPMDLSRNERRDAAAVCLAELGSSERPPANWIRLYLRELDDPQAAIAEWSELNAAESALLNRDSPDTDIAGVYDLLERHLTRCNEMKLTAETAAALVAIIDLADRSGLSSAPHFDQALSTSQLEAGIAGGILWVIQHERWDIIEPLEERYEETIRTSRKLLYYLAAASAKAGRGKRAEELADRAFEIPEDEQAFEGDRVYIAKVIAELGYVAWAEREYRWVIEDRPVIDEQSMEARSDLAMWLHDREDYQGAAAVLGEFCDAADADEPAKQRLIEELDLSSGSGRELLRNVEARREFYRACVDEARGNYARQQRRLEDAAKKYDKDPDILIAMYRSPGADEDYQQRTRVRIRATAKYMQSLIDENPDNPTCYNQWAWLIANTEGDQQLAVEYSLNSLKLRPEEPSYLDTLGRCYYAVGDYENAVKYQRRAVKMAPHYGVMQRQLELFERALAEGTSAGGQVSDSPDEGASPPQSGNAPSEDAAELPRGDGDARPQSRARDREPQRGDSR